MDRRRSEEEEIKMEEKKSWNEWEDKIGKEEKWEREGQRSR